LPETTETIIHIAMIRLRELGWQYDDAFQTRSYSPALGAGRLHLKNELENKGVGFSLSKSERADGCIWLQLQPTF
jgi:hypothetical protein